MYREMNGLRAWRWGLAAATAVGLLAQAGCGGISTGGSLLAPPPPVTTPVTTNPAVVAKNVYYCSPGFESLYVFEANQSGTVTPTSTISVPGGPFAVTGDAAGTLYVASGGNSSGVVSATAAGATMSSRVIQLPAPVNGGANSVATMTTDAAGNLYVATDDATILVFGPTANGTEAPLRTISGALTTLNVGATQMVVDGSGNLYVAEGSGYTGTQLVRFGPTATGNVGPVVMTDSTYLPVGVALDAKGNLYMAQSGQNPETLNYPSAIYEFAAGFSPGDAPIKSIVGSNTQLGFYLHDLQIDAAGNIFVMQYIGLISVFGAGANGNVAPASTLSNTKSYSTDSQFYLR